MMDPSILTQAPTDSVFTPTEFAILREIFFFDFRTPGFPVCSASGLVLPNFLYSYERYWENNPQIILITNLPLHVKINRKRIIRKEKARVIQNLKYIYIYSDKRFLQSTFYTNKKI